MERQAEVALAAGRIVVWHAQTEKTYRGLSKIADRLQLPETADRDCYLRSELSGACDDATYISTSDWRSRDPSQADDARRLSRFVSGLPDFDPIYRSWLKSPKTKKETVPVPLSEAVAKRLLIENITRYDLPPDPWPEAGELHLGRPRRASAL